MCVPEWLAGMNWESSSCSPPNGDDYVAALAFAKLPAWSKYNLTVDHACIPINNTITSNRWCNCPQFIDVSPSDIAAWMDHMFDNTEDCSWAR